MNYDDNQKNNRKKINKDQKKHQKHFFDEDQFLKQKINKEFKHKKKSIIEDDDDWKNWDIKYDR